MKTLLLKPDGKAEHHTAENVKKQTDHETNKQSVA